MHDRHRTLELIASESRRSLTPSESALWAQLRAGQLGAHFKRQVVLGRFIVDFLAPKQRVIVELDGAYHARRRAADARRDRKLERSGYRVLRIDAELVRSNLAEAVALVRVALAEPP